MKKVLFIVNGLLSHYMAVKPLVTSLQVEPVFLIINGYAEDTDKIRLDLHTNGWNCITEPQLASNASKSRGELIDDTFTPSLKFCNTQIPILRKVLRKIDIRHVCIESYNTLAATAAELEGLDILAFRIFYLKPRVSYKNGLWEDIKNKLVSAKELSGINAYRLKQKRPLISSAGYRSKFANLHPCYQWYSDVIRKTETDYFIGPVLETPAQATDPELAAFMADGKVILITFGTTVDDVSTVSDIANHLANTGHKVVVAGSAGAHFYHPNIYHREWIPLKQITRNTLLAVVHGGANTVTIMLEAQVPMVVVPYFGDQFAHADRVDELRIGLKAQHQSNTEIISSLTAMLYKEALKNAHVAYQNAHKTNHHILELHRLNSILANRDNGNSSVSGNSNTITIDLDELGLAE